MRGPSIDSAIHESDVLLLVSDYCMLVTACHIHHYPARELEVGQLDSRLTGESYDGVNSSCLSRRNPLAGL